jgi:hypothetical protein
MFLALAIAGRTFAADQDVVKFTRLSVKDPGINNIECVSMLIPAGWTTEGGVQWFPDYAILANLLMRITDPQSGAMIEFLPIQHFTHIANPVVPMQPGQNYMGMIVWEPITDIPRFVQTFYMPQVLQHLQHARQLSQENLDKVAATYAQAYGLQHVKCGRVRYEFDHAGQTWQEDVYVTITYTPWEMGTLWSVPSAYSFRAPKGKLDAMTPQMAATVNSMRLNLDWFAGYQYVQKLFNDRMAGSIRDARAISDTITRNSEEIRRMYSDSYRRQSESQDRISASFSEYVRGVETYKNPFEDRPVQLPSGYNDAWVNARGEYILSNSAGFDPNVGDTTEWRRMPTAR